VPWLQNLTKNKVKPKVGTKIWKMKKISKNMKNYKEKRMGMVDE